MGIWSFSIERLAADLRSEGIAVNLYSTALPDDVAGRFRYPDEAEPEMALQIDINEENARAAFLTLAHEAGHYRAWLAGGPHGEPEAEAFGWVELQRLNAPVSLAEWRAFHEERS